MAVMFIKARVFGMPGWKVLPVCECNAVVGQITLSSPYGIGRVSPWACPERIASSDDAMRMRAKVVVLVIRSTDVSTAKSCDGWSVARGHYSTIIIYSL